jgi:hypothetical protein
MLEGVDLRNSFFNVPFRVDRRRRHTKYLWPSCQIRLGIVKVSNNSVEVRHSVAEEDIISPGIRMILLGMMCLVKD